MHRFRANDGVEVAAYELGGDGPPLLLAHATGFHAHVWEPVAVHLRDSFRCIAFDERGHGDSGVPVDGNFDWHGFSLDALAVVDGLALERPFAAGHSCGGALLLLAEQARPGTFAALYCFEPIMMPSDPPLEPNDDNPLSRGARRRREVFASRDEAFANYAGKPPFSALAPDALRAYVAHGFEDLPDGTVRLKCRGENEARSYAMGMAHDAYAHLAEIGCPVTLVSGEHTDAIPAEVIDALAAKLPLPATEVAVGVGHFGPLEDPALVAASIRRAFIGSKTTSA